MKVKCIFNTGEGLSQKTLDAGYKKDSKFNVEIGVEYTVYSMILWGGSLDCLLSPNDSECPSWYPAELFKVTNHLLPFVWYFNFEEYKNYKGEIAQKAIWGYKEMVSDSDHHIALTESKPEALNVFQKRKRQIDEFEELNTFVLKNK